MFMYEQWIGIRNDPVSRPTFPQKGIMLMGNTDYLARTRIGAAEIQLAQGGVMAYEVSRYLID